MESKPIKIFQWTSLKQTVNSCAEYKEAESVSINQGKLTQSTSITQRPVNSSIHLSKALDTVGLVETLLSKSRAMIHLRKLSRIVYGIVSVYDIVSGVSNEGIRIYG